MFFLKKKNKGNEIVAMATGKILSIDNSVDEVFANKIIGDGFLIRPSNNQVVSPVSGEIIMTFPTKHAIGIKDLDGNEYLIHVGVDTVSLNGDGFESSIEVGQKVEKGELLLTCDFEGIKNRVKSTDVILIFTDKRSCEVIQEKLVQAGESNIIKIDGGK